MLGRIFKERAGSAWGVTLVRNILTAAASLLFFVSISVSTAQAATPVCKSKNINGRSTSYCFQKPDVDSDTLVVFFHGIYGNEKKWFEDGKFSDLQKNMNDRGLNPWIVTISYGNIWLMSETDKSKQLFSYVLDTALPSIIQEVHPQAFAKKFLIGYSMGGLNASQVFLKRTDMFDKYVLLSPAIAQVGPFSTRAEIQDYIHRTEATSFLVSMLIDIGRNNFRTKEEWDNFAPLTLLSKQPIRQYPPIYISAGPRDQYGFDEGCNLFSLAIAPMSTNSVWMPIPNGDHMTIDQASITDFLLQ